jgi:dye decolorizing peroxidase
MTGRSAEPVVSRRRLLTTGAVAGAAGVVAGATPHAGTADLLRAGSSADRATAGGADTADAATSVGAATEDFHGPRQAGVATIPQAHAAFVAFTLRAGVDRSALVRFMKLITDDAARLSRGEAPLADTEADLATFPARLTITVGFGPGLYHAAGADDRRPPSVADLPRFPIDRLEPAWTGVDLLLQICADDPLTVTHAQRMLIKDSRPFATVRWIQRGFRRSVGVQDPAQTQRNVLGQLDGTANPQVGAAQFDQAVWITEGPDWLRDSSTVVVRRIRAEMETWDLLGRSDKELAVGRRLDTGAPLTGKAERDLPDFTATTKDGLPVIPDFAHISRAHVTDDRLRILRRPYNYDNGAGPDGTADSGLIFASFQADIDRQYLPIQRRLAERDLLNAWTTPIGSAVFAIPPGCAPGGWLGEPVLS